MRTGQNAEQIVDTRKDITQCFLKREGDKKKDVITRGIRIWSPIQVLTPPNRA